jgi:outer membrane lipoprotein-sorting protein
MKEKKFFMMIEVWVLALVMIVPSLAQEKKSEAQKKEFTALEILKKSDSVANAPKDQEIIMEMILIDKKGKQKKRGAKMLQKGSEKRMIKFLSPADVKGLAFLDLPNDMMYLYLPAFKKIRRIASHVKNTSFAGTDFTYDDMASINYADEWVPGLMESKKEIVSVSAEKEKELESKECEHYLLELKPKEGIKKDYSKLVMWVRKDNFYPARIEHYSREGKLWKIMERRKIVKEAKYWVSKETEMNDLKKEHKTKMLISEVKFDQGLKDELFSQRYLKRK